MKKHLLLVFALAFMVPWATRAQDCTQTVPYTQNFESYTGTTYSASTGLEMPTCWNGYSSSTSTTNIYMPRVVSGTGSYVYYHGAKGFAMTGGTNTSYGMNKYVFLPPMSVPLNQLQLGFWMCTEGSTATVGTLVVGYVTSDDTSTFVPIQSYPSSSATAHSGNGQQSAGVGLDVELALSLVPTTATRLAFKWEHSNSSYHTCCIDDIVLDYLPTCPRVDNISVVPSVDGGVVSWSEMGSATQWELTVSDTTGVVSSSIVSTNPATITNLDPNTAYTLAIRAICGSNDTSWARSLDFRTACVALTTADLPYTYGFEDATGSGATNEFNPCWSRHYIGGTTNYPYPYSTYKHSGSYSLYFTNSTTITKVWTTLPELDASVPITSLSVGFWAYKTAAAGGRVKVGVMTDPDSVNTFTPIASMQVSATSTWEYFEFPFSSYTGTGTYVAIMTDTNGTNLTCIDDVTLMVTPSCARPEAVAVSDINTTGATLTITDPTNVGNYRIDVTGDSVFTVTTTTTTYTFTGLDPDADYTMAVSAVCSDGNATSPNYVSFRTPCVALSDADLPYTYGFDDATGSSTSGNISFCWGRYHLGTTSNYPYPSTTYKHSGTHSLYFYNTTAIKSWATLPLYNGDITGLTVSFWAYKTSSTYYMKVGVMTDPDSINTFTQIARVQPSTTSTWEYFEIPLTGYTGTGTYITLMVDSTASNYMYVDDVTLMVSPSCARIQGFTVTNPTSDGATVTIDDPTNVNNYVITVTHDSIDVNFTATSTTYVMTGLQPNTPYEISVYADCGDGTVTTPRDGSFRTACAPISDLPWNDDFEDQPSSATPYCWNSLNGTNTVLSNSSNAHSGSKYLRFSGSTIGNIIALPQISEDLQWSDLALHFWTRPESNTNVNCGTFSLGYFTSDTVWVKLDSCAYNDFSTLAYVEKDIALTNVPNGAVVAFRQDAGLASWYWYVDDVELYYNSSCARAQGIAVENLSETSADIVITDTMEVGNYVVTVIHGTDTTDYATSALEVNLTDLTPNTTYKVVMVTDCGDGYTLPYTMTFTTPCAGIDSLPWTENFNSYVGGTSGTVTNRMDIPCWTIPYRYGANYPYYNNGSSYNSDNGNCLYNYHSTNNPVVIVLPNFDFSPEELMFTLDVRVATTGNGVEVGVVTNPNDRSTFTPVAVCNPTATGEWQTFHVTFPGVTDGFIAFRNTGSAAVYLDNFVVDFVPPCVPPTVTVSGITTTSVTLNFVDINNSGSYYVYTSATDSVLISGESDVISGLTAGTDYTYYARTLCGDELSSDSTLFSFRTLCNPTAIPFFENFDSLTSSYNSNNNGMLPCWDIVKNVPAAYVTAYTSGTYLYGGSGASLKFNPSAANARTIIVLPVFDMPLDSLELTFQTRPEGTSASSGSFDVGYLSDTNFVALQHYDYSDFSGEYQMKAVTFDNAPEGARIAMRHNAAASNWYWFVDEVDVHMRPSCSMPQAVYVDNITTTTADVHVSDSTYVGNYYVMLNNGSTLDTVLITDTMATLTSLLSGTYYSIRVVALCPDGNTTAYVDDEFLTLCAPVSTLPYVETFESWGTGSANVHPCWDHLYKGASGVVYNSYPYVSSSTTTAYEGSKYLNFYSYGAASSKYYSVAFMPEFTAPVNTLSMSFYYKASASPANSRMYVGVSSSVDDTSTFVIIDSIVPANTSWNQYEVDFGTYTGAGTRITLMQASTSSSYISGYIDSIVVDTLGTCNRPNALTISNVTASSATLNWVDVNGTGDYRIYWTDDAGTTDSADVSDALTYDLTGLMSSTTYDVAIKRLCWGQYTRARVATFTTPCVAISVADTLRENFETVEATSYSSTTANLPSCWDSWSSNGATVRPHVTDSAIYSYCVDGRKAITFTAAGSNTSYGPNSYVALPNIIEPTNSLAIAFWMCTEGGDNMGELSVGYLTGANYETDFVALKTITASAATQHSGNGIQPAGHGVRDTVYFDSVPSGNYTIAFRWHKESTYYSCCIDDIAVWVSSGLCLTPNVTVTDTAETTVSLSWTGSGTDYEVATVAGSWNNPSTGTPVTGNTYTVTGLTPGTQYAIGVRAVCDEGVYSEWNVVNVTTLEHPCYAPTALTATNPTMDGATLNWTPADADQTTFEIRVSAAGDTTYLTVNEHPVTLTGLHNSTTYSVAVRAICGTNNYSEWSNTATFTTADCQSVSGVTVSAVTATGATVTWTPNGSSSYEVGYGPIGTTTDNCTRRTTTTASYTITGLEGGLTYVVYVRSICAEGVYSDWTSGTNFTTETQGIDDVDNAGISLYPNPASSTVTLAGIEGQATVTVVDMNGRQVYTGNTANGSLTIDLGGMAQGAYFVRITGERVNAIRKLIVR